MQFREDLLNKLKELGVDENIVLIGRGSGRHRAKGSKPRYYMTVTKKRPATQKFVIQFCLDIEQYIVWIRDYQGARGEKLSVKAEDVPSVKNGKVESTRKYLGFVGREEEDIYTFRLDGVETFFKKMKVI